MSSSGPTNTTPKPRGPRFVSIPIQTMAQAQGLTSGFFSIPAYHSAKGACQAAGNALSKDVGSVAFASSEPHPYGIGITIPRPKPGETLSALALVNKLGNDANTCCYNLSGSAFHLSCPVEWLLPNDLQTTRELAQNEELGKLWPIMVWEPYFEGPHCRPDKLGAIKDACRRFPVFAPNHNDLLAMCSKASDFANRISTLKGHRRIDSGRKIIEECVKQFLDAGTGTSGRGYVVVKAGEFGCLLASLAFGDTFTWLAALKGDKDELTDLQKETAEFVGAFVFERFVKKETNTVKAAKLALVAASFAAGNAFGSTSAFEAQEDASREIWRREVARLQFARDLDDPSAYEDDQDDGTL